MVENNLKILTFDLKSISDFRAFSYYQADFLNLLRNAYGRRYFGDENYLERIRKRSLIILLALDQNNREVVGSLHYKHSGKLAGLAVHEEYRNLGIATRLIDKAQKNFHYLFGEVDERKVLVMKILNSCGFKKVKDMVVIERNLKQEKDNVSLLDTLDDGTLVYFHSKNKRKNDIYKKFIMFEWSKN